MKAINIYINEKLVLNKSNVKNYGYNYFPENTKELIVLIDKLIKERGNNADLNDIDVSNIKDMSFLFYNSEFNGDISQWDVSNVTNMKAMFMYSKFNGDISSWDVSNVKYMTGTFAGCKNFTGKSIENWNVSSLEDMYSIFEYCDKFNADLGSWDVSNVTDMRLAFYLCKKFEGIGLEKWNTQNIKAVDKEKMFSGCDSLKNIPNGINN